MQLQSVHQFSHIYIEEAASGLEETHLVIENIRRSGQNPNIIPIPHYKEIFNRPRQNFAVQKNRPALILAKENQNFLYKGNERINSWNNSELYYNALVRNCVYNCDYCFLQGMHSSAHSVMFLNNRDFLQRADEQLSRNSMYLSISYLSEILAFEPLFPYTRQWVDFARNRENFELEIRTKSDYYQALSGITPAKNVNLVWSLSPELVSRSHERGCASFNNRLFAAAKAAADGWPLKITIDPVLMVENWTNLYADMIGKIFDRIPAEKIRELSFGVFRMNADFLGRIRKFRVDSPVIQHSYYRSGDLLSYAPDQINDVRQFMHEQLQKHIPEDRIFFVHG